MKTVFLRLICILLIALCMGNIVHAQTDIATEEGKKIHISCMAINGSEIYVGTENHGVYHSADGGYNWAPANSGLPIGHSNIEALVISGSNVVAIRHNDSNNRQLYLSSSKGSGWTRVKFPGSIDAFPHKHIADYNNMLFVTTEKGLLRSSDNGTSWAVVPAMDTAPVTAIVSTDKFIVAGLYDGGVRSSKDGIKWSEVTTTLTGGAAEMEVHGHDVYIRGCHNRVYEYNGNTYCPTEVMAVLNKNGRRFDDIDVMARYFAFDEGNIYAITTEVTEKKRQGFVYERKVLKFDAYGEDRQEVDEKTDSFVTSDPHIQTELAELEGSKQEEINQAMRYKQGSIESSARLAARKREMRGDSRGFTYYGPVLPSSGSSTNYRALSNDRFKERYNHRDSWIDSRGKIHSN